MATYVIEIKDEIIEEQIANILNSELKYQLKSKYSDSGRVISEAIKELIYSRKDEIIEMVVDRAAKEIVRKGLPKLLERMEG